jgi:hypothetical protein
MDSSLELCPLAPFIYSQCKLNVINLYFPSPNFHYKNTLDSMSIRHISNCFLILLLVVVELDPEPGPFLADICDNSIDPFLSRKPQSLEFCFNTILFR